MKESERRVIDFVSNAIDDAILACPTGDIRELLTELNIRWMKMQEEKIQKSSTNSD